MVLSPLSSLLLLAGLLALASLALMPLLEGLLRRRALFDHPNERSSHQVPVPRGAGLVIVPLTLAGLATWLYLEKSLAELWPLLLAALLLFGISWLDDRRNLSALPRLAVQALAVGLGLWALGDRVVSFGASLDVGIAVPLAVIFLLLAAAWLWFINLFNFMDGIDGITGVEALSILSGILLLYLLEGSELSAFGPLAILLAVLPGFLLANWHPAGIFLGDSGSVPLGFLIGWQLIELFLAGYWAVALILPAFYWADATLVLAERLLKGKKPWQAHREHYYQRAHQGGLSHAQVCKRLLCLNLLLILVTLTLAGAQPLLACLLAGLATAALLLHFRQLHRKAQDDAP